MREAQFIRNVKKITAAQARKRLNAGEQIDLQMLRFLRRSAAAGSTQQELEQQAARVRQIAVNTAAGVVAGYVPLTVEALLDGFAGSGDEP